MSDRWGPQHVYYKWQIIWIKIFALCIHVYWTGTKKSALALWPRRPTTYDQNATHLCMPLNTYTNSYSIKALKPYIIVIECMCCFILHMPIAQLPLPKYFHHNTLQYLASLSHLFPMSRHLTMLLSSAFEHLRKKLQHMFGVQCYFHAPLCAGEHVSNLTFQ